MTKEQKLIKTWMQTFGQKCPDKPTIPDIETCLLRAKLILEEAIETVEALGFRVMVDNKEVRNKNMGDIPYDLKHVSPCSLTEVADGLADLNVVAYCGTGNACGLDMEPIFEEVNRSNTTKGWNEVEINNDPRIKSGELTAKASDQLLMIDDFENPIQRSYVVRNKDNKIIKSPSYSPADIESIIYKQSL